MFILDRVENGCTTVLEKGSYENVFSVCISFCIYSVNAFILGKFSSNFTIKDFQDIHNVNCISGYPADKQQ